MSTGAAYLTEARDAHGRWIHGIGEINDLLDDLKNKGSITGAQRNMIAQAFNRHTEMKRGIPDTKDPSKILEYVARTLRHDSLTYRQQKPPDIQQSKRLSRIARQVEIAHAAHLGIARKNMSGINPYQLTPHATPLDGPSGKPATVLDIKPKLKQKAAEAKAKVTAPSKPKVTTPKAPKGLKVSGEVKVIKKVSAVQILASAIKPGDIIDMGQARIPAGTKQKMSKYGHYAHTVAVYQRVKIERRVLGVASTNEGQQVRVYLSEPLDDRIVNAEGKVTYKTGGGGWYGSSYDTVDKGATEKDIGVKSVVKVKRLVETKKMAGTKVKLSEHPSAQTFHQALTDALANGEDLSQFDPSLRPLAGGQSVGHAQQLLYDMAVGKASGKVGTGRVVTDEEYTKRLDEQNAANNYTSELERIDEKARHSEPYVGFGTMYGYKEYSGVQLPGTASKEDIARLYAATRAGEQYDSNSMRARREQFKNEYMATHEGEPSIHDFAKTLTPSDYAQYLKDLSAPRNQQTTGYATEIQKNVLSRREQRIEAKVNEAVRTRIAEMRKAEGTVGRDYNMPTWDNAVMEPQTWDSIQSHIDKQAEPIIQKGSPSNATLASAIYESLNNHVPLEPDSEIYNSVDQHQARLRAAQDLVDHNRIDQVKQALGLANISALNATPNTRMMFDQLSQSQRAVLVADIERVEKEAEGETSKVSTHDYTPSFYSAGVVDDGVLYHRSVTQEINGFKMMTALRGVLENDPNLTSGDAIANAQVFFNAGTPNIDGVMSTGDQYDFEAVRSTIQKAQNINEATRAKLLQTMDRIERRVSKGGSVTTGHISAGPANNAMRKTMLNMGAIETVDDKARGGKGTWAELKPGNMLLVQEGGKPLSEEDQVRVSAAGVMSMPGWNNDTGIGPDWQGIKNAYDSAETLDARLAAIAAYEKSYKSSSTYEYGGSLSKQTFDQWAGLARAAVNYAKALRTEEPGKPIKRIEYAPWQQPSGPTVNARSARGRLTLEGYTPDEAAAKLREMGVIGDLETHVPAGSIFRSTRRAGTVTPLLPDYVRGDVQPPTSENLLTHGVTSRGNPFTEFTRIATSGGLMSISERQKRGIRTSTTSQVGDIASGIDHVVFCGLGEGGGCGSGSPVRLVLRPDTLMRRDVVLAPTDFGGGKNRFGLYKKYRDKLDAQAGVEVGKTDLWSPLSPGARQRHLDDKNNNSGSSEYNIAGTVSLEDIEAVAVKDPELGAQIQGLLDDLLKQGIITRAPNVISKNNLSEATKGIAQPPIVKKSQPQPTSEQLVNKVAGL